MCGVEPQSICRAALLNELEAVMARAERRLRVRRVLNIVHELVLHLRLAGD